MRGADRISALPDSILSHILSFLPINEAVGTSFLATRWRYVFFEKFCLKGSKWSDSPHVYDWIFAAVRRGVKHIDLSISLNVLFIILPGSLFTCTSLISLKLDIGHLVLDVSDEFLCPNLKTLHLKSVEFPDDDSVKNLLSGCRSLEEMVLEQCRMNNISRFNISHRFLKRLTMHYSHFCSDCWLVIDTPNLAYFKYSDRPKAGYSVVHLPSLVEAEISIFNVNHPQADAIELFRGICNARSLTLSSTSLKLLLSCQLHPVFATLARLRIHYDPGRRTCGYNHWENGLESFLTSCNELEELIVYKELVASIPDNPSLWTKLELYCEG